jgi:hypothetical protein
LSLARTISDRRLGAADDCIGCVIERTQIVLFWLALGVRVAVWIRAPAWRLARTLKIIS